MANKKKKKALPIDGYSVSNSLYNFAGETTLLGKKLTDIAIGQIEEIVDESTGNKKLVSNVNGTKIKELLGLSSKSNGVYTEIKKLLNPDEKYVKNGNAIPQLSDWKVFYSDDENEKLMVSNVITDCYFSNGVMRIEWNYNLRKYLMKLQGDFTLFSYSLTTKRIKHEPAYDLYKELKKQIDKTTAIYGELDGPYETEVDLIDLKILLGKVKPEINKKLLEAYRDLSRKTFGVLDELDDDALVKELKEIKEFNRRTLNPSIKEINEKTDLLIDVKQSRVGRGGKTVGYRFFVTYKEKKEEDDVEQEKKEFYEKLEKLLVFERGQKPSASDIESIAEAGEYDLERITYAYNQTIGPHSTPIQNVVTYMIGILKKTPVVPKDPIRQSAKNGFHNFEQRDYDYDELENKWLHKGKKQENENRLSETNDKKDSDE